MLEIYLNDKGRSVKNKLLNIFKEIIMHLNHATMVGYNESALSNALWVQFCCSHGNYKPELKEYFPIYGYQLNFAMFCATSALGISWQMMMVILRVIVLKMQFPMWQSATLLKF